jgi:hypothetical protein
VRRFVSVSDVADRREYQGRFVIKSAEEERAIDYPTPTAYIGCRTVDGQNPQVILTGLQELLGDGYTMSDAIAQPFCTGTDSPGMRAAIASAQAITGKYPSVEHCGGSIGAVKPLSLLVPSAPCALIGFYEEEDCGMHGEHERFAIPLYVRHVATMAHLFGNMPGPL